jgi:hypothetical protein
MSAVTTVPSALTDAEVLQRVLESQNMTLDKFRQMAPSAQKNHMESERRLVGHERQVALKRERKQLQLLHQQESRDLSKHEPQDEFDENATVVDMSFVENYASTDDSKFARFKDLAEMAGVIKKQVMNNELLAAQYGPQIDSEDIHFLKTSVIGLQKRQLQIAVSEMNDLYMWYTDQCRMRVQTYQELNEKLADSGSNKFKEFTARKIDVLKERVNIMTKELAQLLPSSNQ